MEQSKVKSPPEEERVRCPSCRKTLALRKLPGQYEVQNRGRSSKDGPRLFRQLIYAGTVFCPRCGLGVSIPPIKVATRPATKEGNNARK